MTNSGVKKIVILGATGSIGRQAVEVVLEHPDQFEIIALAARSDIQGLAAQAARIKPKFVCVVDDCAAKAIEDNLPLGCELLRGTTGVEYLCALPDADIVLNAIVGSAGLVATLTAVKADKRLALANKESFVAAGELVNKAIDESGAEVIPVDSEHSAIWQCLAGEERASVSKLILTASGGPFLNLDEVAFEAITPEMALAHPKWTMGPRITIDSATMMNKGLEVIEAVNLFRLPPEAVEVVIHPQAIVHSLVEFTDGSAKAQLGLPDMKLPIQLSFSWPKRLAASTGRARLAKIGALEFQEPRIARWPCLRMAYEAARLGASYPTVLNAADEIAVAAFLDDRIRFTEIGNIVGEVVEAHEPFSIDTLEAYEAADSWARNQASALSRQRSNE